MTADSQATPDAHAAPPPEPPAAYDELDRLALMGHASTHGTHGPAKPAGTCCRSRATDDRMARMGDPFSHMGHGDEPDPAIMPVVLDPGATIPTRAHPKDAGLDLRALDNLPEPIRLLPGQIKIVPTGVRVAIMDGCVGKLEGRSGLSSKGIIPLGALDMGDMSPDFILGGVIDQNFTGPIGIILANVGLIHWEAQQGKALCQLVEYRIAKRAPMVVDAMGETDRGEGGFGSSDHKGAK